MVKLTKTESRVLDMAKTLGAFTPTQLGLKLGYPHVQASSRVAPALRALHGHGLLFREQTGHNRVTYRVVTENR